MKLETLRQIRKACEEIGALKYRTGRLDVSRHVYPHAEMDRLEILILNLQLKLVTEGQTNHEGVL